MADATRSLTDLFGILGPRRDSVAAAAPDSSVTNVAEVTFPTKALHKFLVSLQASEGPLLVDLGPVVGSNVTFFGEQLGCRLRVEDVAKDIDRHVKDNTLEQLPDYFTKRFTQPAGTVDGMGPARTYSTDRLSLTVTYSFGLGDPFTCTGCEK